MSQKLSRRQLLELGSVVAVTGVIAACSPKAPTAAPTAEPKQQATPVPEATKPPTTVPAAKVVSIRFGMHDQITARETTNKRFKEEHPEIEVQLEQIGEFHDKVYAMAALAFLNGAAE